MFFGHYGMRNILTTPLEEWKEKIVGSVPACALTNPLTTSSPAHSTHSIKRTLMYRDFKHRSVPTGHAMDKE